MSKQVKKVYRIIAWFFSVIIAAGTLTGCWGTKYGAPTTKYGPPSPSGYNLLKEDVAQKGLEAEKDKSVEVLENKTEDKI